jgi:ribosomal-protein-alanine acetyltransferase
MFVKIRLAVPEDLVSIIEIERSSATAAHWSEEGYGWTKQRVPGDLERLVLVAEGNDPVDPEKEVNLREPFRPRTRRQREGIADLRDETPSEAQLRRDSVVGFLVARHVNEEWELENIVVAAKFRRQGIGKRLLGALVAQARDANGEAIFVEVRESNLWARQLYQKAGFRETGRRRLYYSNPAEDAILYSCRL